MTEQPLGTPAAVLAAQIGRPERWVRVLARRHNWLRVEIGNSMFFPDEALDAIKAQHLRGEIPPPANPHGRVTRRRAS